MSGQGKSGQVGAGQGKSGQVRAGQGRSGQVRAGQGRSGQVRASQGKSGQVRAGLGRAGHVTKTNNISGTIREGKLLYLAMLHLFKCRFEIKMKQRMPECNLDTITLKFPFLPV